MRRPLSWGHMSGRSSVRSPKQTLSSMTVRGETDSFSGGSGRAWRTRSPSARPCRPGRPPATSPSCAPPAPAPPDRHLLARPHPRAARSAHEACGHPQPHNRLGAVTSHPEPIRPQPSRCSQCPADDVRDQDGGQTANAGSTLRTVPALCLVRLAVAVGFEPTDACTSHAFEVCNPTYAQCRAGPDRSSGGGQAARRTPWGAVQLPPELQPGSPLRGSYGPTPALPPRRGHRLAGRTRSTVSGMIP
jgi:hypothetical protein